VIERPRPGGTALGLYGGAFAVMLMAGAFLGAAMLDELQDTTMLWISAVLSIGAVVLAAAALLLLRRSTG
jgi:predicted MFS family arabinose efflux permease